MPPSIIAPPIHAEDIRPPSQLGRRMLDGKTAVGGVVVALGAHVLLPAAIASGIGSQTQKPLARVVVGGTVTTVFAVLFLVPLMARKWAPVDRNPDRGGEDSDGENDLPNDGPPSPLELGRLLLSQHFQRPLPEDADADEPSSEDS